MSNANTPAMMAQSMAESLFRENARLKKIEESYYQLLELDSGDVMIDTLNENDRLKEQNALLTVQVQRSVTKLQIIADDMYPAPVTDFAKSAIAEVLSALPQQAKSEAARDAAQGIKIVPDQSIPPDMMVIRVGGEIVGAVVGISAQD